MDATAVGVEFDLPFATPPDLDATMDIQIPALAWQPDPTGGYRRVLHLDGQPITVIVREANGGLHVTASHPHDELPDLLRRMFPDQVADLDLGTNPVWAKLRSRYRGLIVGAAVRGSGHHRAVAEPHWRVRPPRLPRP